MCAKVFIGDPEDIDWTDLEKPTVPNDLEPEFPGPIGAVVAALRGKILDCKFYGHRYPLGVYAAKVRPTQILAFIDEVYRPEWYLTRPEADINTMKRLRALVRALNPDMYFPLVGYADPEELAEEGIVLEDEDWELDKDGQDDGGGDEEGEEDHEDGED